MWSALRRPQSERGRRRWRPIAAGLLAVPLLLTTSGKDPVTSALAGATIGPTKPGSGVIKLTPRRAQAFRATSTSTGRVGKLSVFVDASSRPRRSTRLHLGLYRERPGGGHKRIARCTITVITVDAWNACRFKSITAQHGAPYWTAVLQPVRADTRIRIRAKLGSGRSGVSSRRSLGSLPRIWRSGAQRSRQGALFASAPRAPSSPVPVSVPRAAVHCDLDVSSRSALVSAVENVANGGRTVCAHAADYGTNDLELGVRHQAMLTLAAAPNERVTLPFVVLAGVSNLRIEGFDMPHGGFDTAEKSARDIELVGNEIHDCACQALRIWGGDRDILFERNYVHDIRHDGRWTTGWGINATGGNGGSSGLAIRYNTFDRLGNDAMEIASDDGEIVGNVIKRVDADPAYPDTHPDAIMLWGDSQRWLIKDNRISDGRGILMSGSTSDVRIENNLIVRIKNFCHDGGTTGSSSAGLVRYSWIRNTMVDCGSYWNGVGYGLLSDGPGSDNSLERNLLDAVTVDRVSQFVRSDHNLLRSGSRPGASDLTFTPQFADTVNYRPTNLPAGYGDVGYRAAPAGHDSNR